MDKQDGFFINNKLQSWSFPLKSHKKHLTQVKKTCGIWIPKGGGQSYGDSNFSFRGESIIFKTESTFILDVVNKKLRVSGAANIFETQNFLAKSYLSLPIVPGTMRATIGGCIASDVHGKNSHQLGSFGEHVTEIKLNNGSTTNKITPQDEEIWRATIGGQGLTGFITECVISLVKIKSKQLEQFLEL